MKEWQNRPLKKFYTFVFVDCLYVNIRKEMETRSCAVYVVLGYDINGIKDILGIWIGESEGKHYWMQIFDEIKNRGVEDLAQLNANTSMWSPYTSHMILTDWAVEDASFLRLNTLSLGYTIPATLTKLAGINSLRFYVTAYNVFTITKYDGYDPESDCIRTTALTPNVDYSGYPRSRQFVIGMNLNF